MVAMTNDAGLVLRNGRLDDGRLVDMRLHLGKIASIEPAGTAASGVDLAGGLVLPGLIDGHIHLDKTHLGLPWMPHQPGGSVTERIEAEKAIRRGLEEPMAVRARRMVDHVVARGTTTLRSHVDIDTEVRLAGVEALLELRQSVRDRIDIELVAFPQSGVISHPGAAELMDEALRLGVEVVGGLDPAGIDGAIDAQLDILFGLAIRHGKPIDIHLHDPGTLGCYQLQQIAARSQAAGLEGRVVVSHAFALGGVDEDRFKRTADALAAGGVAIMTNGPGTATMPPVKALAAHGVTVFVGSDNIRDAWSPYGNGDMLDRARLVGYRSDLVTDAELRLALDLVTSHTAEVMGRPATAIAPGAPADLVVVRARHVPEAVAVAPPRELVIKRGRIVARDGGLTV
jgi:cytosine/adenosine deaminase-related metal-dependent hydrolase